MAGGRAGRESVRGQPADGLAWTVACNDINGVGRNAVAANAKHLLEMQRETMIAELISTDREMTIASQQSQRTLSF